MNKLILYLSGVGGVMCFLLCGCSAPNVSTPLFKQQIREKIEGRCFLECITPVSAEFVAMENEIAERAASTDFYRDQSGKDSPPDILVPQRITFSEKTVGSFFPKEGCVPVTVLEVRLQPRTRCRFFNKYAYRSKWHVFPTHTAWIRDPVAGSVDSKNIHCRILEPSNLAGTCDLLSGILEPGQSIRFDFAPYIEAGVVSENGLLVRFNHECGAQLDIRIEQNVFRQLR